MNPRTVLIVEDVESCATTLEIAVLQLGNVDVQVVPSAHQALERLSADGNICALVTDLNLPRMDGFELIERVRAMDTLARLPIVVVSGESDPQIRSRLARIGADAYFPKPFSPGEVRRRLQELLNAHP
jgi:CheY-like chemotaxis protein